MGNTAENVVRRWKISRADRRLSPWRVTERHLSLEIVSIGNASATVEPDGRIRADDSADGLAALKPAI